MIAHTSLMVGGSEMIGYHDDFVVLDIRFSMTKHILCQYTNLVGFSWSLGLEHAPSMHWKLKQALLSFLCRPCSGAHRVVFAITLLCVPILLTSVIESFMSAAVGKEPCSR